MGIPDLAVFPRVEYRVCLLAVETTVMSLVWVRRCAGEGEMAHRGD